MAIYCADHDLGAPTVLYDNMSDAVCQAAFRAYGRALAKESSDVKRAYVSAPSVWIKDKKRIEALEIFAFDECGAPLKSYHHPTWLTPSRARRAFAEDRFGALENLPIDVIPAETILAAINTKKDADLGPHFWSKMNEAMWEAMLAKGHYHLDVIPLEILTEAKLIAYLKRTGVSLDKVPLKMRTDAVKQAIIDREQAQKAAVEADARKKADTAVSLWKFAKAAEAGVNLYSVDQSTLFTKEEADAVWKERYDSALGFNHFFYGGTGTIAQPMFKSLGNLWKRATVYRGTYPAPYGKEDLARLDAADPDAHKTYDSMRLKKTTKKRAADDDDVAAEDSTVETSVVEVAAPKAKRVRTK